MEKVLINHEKYKIELEPYDWRRIKRGEKEEYYQDKNKSTQWKFNQLLKGACQIETKERTIEIELKDCEIQFIETRPQLDLRKFQELFTPFSSCRTWTKEKHAAHKKLREYMASCWSEIITASRDDKITKVSYVNTFTIFQVESKQRGILMPYRNQFVLMFSKDRYKFQHFLEIYPLAENITEVTLDKIALNAKNYYRKSQ